MQVIAWVSSAVLVVEFILHGLAMLLRMEAGMEPLTKHLGFRPGRTPVLLIGVVDFAVAAGMVAGFWEPVAGTLAAGYAVVLFGVLMVLRFYRRIGTLIRPPDFPLFLVFSILLLLSYLLR